MVDVEYRCFVGGISWDVFESTLEETFSMFGQIVDVKVISDRETGRPKEFGFVTFETEDSMKQAIEQMNGQLLVGHQITVDESQPRRLGHRDGGGYLFGVVLV